MTISRELMKKLIILIVALVIIAFSYWGWAKWQAVQKQKSAYQTAKVLKGEIIQTVTATGTLQPVTTIQVGSQVSGTIKARYVDYNSVVKKGDIMAQIDPELFKAQLAQAKANLASAKSNVVKAEADVLAAQRNWDRNKQLFETGAVSAMDRDNAQTGLEAAQAGLEAAKSAVEQFRASLVSAQTNLNYTTIRAPISGVVISRNVEAGQTVASSFATPTLFLIADDLTKMQVQAAVDEADVGRVQVGQDSIFTVDSFPQRKFQGKVSQIYPSPVVQQNVVTYTTLVDVANNDKVLLPGMTANVSIITGKKENALLVPNAAFRVKLEPATKESGRALGKELGGDPKKPAGLFALWVLADKKPVRKEVEVGLSNEQYTEILSGLKEGDEVITAAFLGEAGSKAPAAGGPRGMRF